MPRAARGIRLLVHLTIRKHLHALLKRHDLVEKRLALLSSAALRSWVVAILRRFLRAEERHAPAAHGDLGKHTASHFDSAQVELGARLHEYRQLLQAGSTSRTSSFQSRDSGEGTLTSLPSRHLRLLLQSNHLPLHTCGRGRTASSGYHSLTVPELHMLKLENLVGRRRDALVADQCAICIQLADSVVAEPEVIVQDPLIVLT